MARRVEGPDFKRRVHRYSEATIRDVTQRSPAFVLEILAPAGSVVCFESGSVHHGKLLNRGERYSFTLYFSAPVGKNTPLKKTAKKKMKTRCERSHCVTVKPRVWVPSPHNVTL